MKRGGILTALMILLPALFFDLSLRLVYPPAAPLVPASVLAVAAFSAGCYPRALPPLLAAFSLGLILDALAVRFFLLNTALLVMAVGMGFLMAIPERRRNPLVAAVALTLLVLVTLLVEVILVSSLGYSGFISRLLSIEWWWLAVFFIMVLWTWEGLAELSHKEVLGERLV